MELGSKVRAWVQGPDVQIASVIDSKLKKFNTDKEGEFGILEHEIDFIKAHPHQAQEYNFKLSESAVPPKRFSFQDLSPDTKVKRCEKPNALFMKIYFWLMREIGVFQRAIKDAQRPNKKIN